MNLDRGHALLRAGQVVADRLPCRHLLVPFDLAQSEMDVVVCRRGLPRAGRMKPYPSLGFTITTNPCWTPGGQLLLRRRRFGRLCGTLFWPVNLASGQPAPAWTVVGGSLGWVWPWLSLLCILRDCRNHNPTEPAAKHVRQAGTLAPWISQLRPFWYNISQIQCNKFLRNRPWHYRGLGLRRR